MPRNVTLTFDDGTQHVYQGVPDEATPDQVQQRAASEFAGKKLTGIDGGAGSGAPAPPADVGKAFAAGNADKMIPGGNAPPPPKPPSASLAGVPGAALAMGTALPAALAGNLRKVVGGLFGEDPYQQDEGAKAIASKIQYQPSPAGAATADAAGELLDRSKLAGLNPADAVTLSGAAAPAATALKNELAAEDSAVAQGLRTAREAKATAAAPKVAVLRKAQDLGLKLLPGETNPSVGNSILEGLGGKQRTAQDLSVKNAPVVNKAVEANFGVDQPLTPTAISEETGKAVGPLLDIRKQAVEQGYDPVRGVGMIPSDGTLTKDLDALTSRGQNAAKGFPNSDVAKDVVTPMVDGLKQGAYDSSSLVDMIGVLREKSKAAFRAGDDSLGGAYGGAAKAFEKLIERHLEEREMPELLDNFRAARTTLAQTRDVAPALTPSGDVNAQVLGNRAKSTTRAPLTGNLKTVADFANTQKQAVQPPARMGSAPAFSPLDAAVGLISPKPETVGAIVGRPLIRKMLTSDWYQKAFVQPQDYLKPGMIERIATAFAGDRPPPTGGAAGFSIAAPGAVAPADARVSSASVPAAPPVAPPPVAGPRVEEPEPAVEASRPAAAPQPPPAAARPAPPRQDARPLPKAPRSPKERVVGVVYDTPKGELEWSEGGWLEPETQR